MLYYNHKSIQLEILQEVILQNVNNMYCLSITISIIITDTTIDLNHI